MFFHMMVTGKKVRQFNIDFLNVNCVYSSLAETYIAQDIKYWKVGNSSYIHTHEYSNRYDIWYLFMFCYWSVLIQHWTCNLNDIQTGLKPTLAGLHVLFLLQIGLDLGQFANLDVGGTQPPMYKFSTARAREDRHSFSIPRVTCKYYGWGQWLCFIPVFFQHDTKYCKYFQRN